MSSLRLTIEEGRFRDSHGREVTLRGINVAGDAKYPSKPEQPSHIPDGFFEGDDVTFLERPFALEDAHVHLSRLKRWGYNTIRYVFTWEAIEHSGPGKFDEEWIQHTLSVLRVAKDYGFLVFMDPHQDVASLKLTTRFEDMLTTYHSGRGSLAALALRCGRCMHVVWIQRTLLPRKQPLYIICTPSQRTSQK